MKTVTMSTYSQNENNYLNLNRKTRGVRKRHRTHFTPDQVEKLEEIFTQQTSNPYRELIVHLSTILNLTDKNIAIWFKNRRAKERRQLNETVVKESSTAENQHKRQGEKTVIPQYSRETTPGTIPPNVTSSATFNSWNSYLPGRSQYQPYYTQTGWRLPHNGYQSTQNTYTSIPYRFPMPRVQTTVPPLESYTTAGNSIDTQKFPLVSRPSIVPEMASYTTSNSQLETNAVLTYGSPYQPTNYNYYPKFESATPISEKLSSSPVNSSTGSSPTHHSFESVKSVSTLPKELIDFVTSETSYSSSNSFSPISTGSDEHSVSPLSFTNYTFPSLQNLAS